LGNGKGWRRIGLRGVLGGTVVLLAAAGASAGFVGLHHATAGPASSAAAPATPPPSAGPPEETPDPTATPVPTPESTPTPAPTAAPTLPPTPRPTAAPVANSTLPHCDGGYLTTADTATRRADGTVLVTMSFHKEWQGSCSFQRGCSLGYSVQSSKSGAAAGGHAFSCSAPWTAWSGDFSVSAVWSTCHGYGDYWISTDYDGMQDQTEYHAAGVEPSGCPPQP